MKLKNLFPFAAALALPLSLVSCGDESKKEEKKEEQGGSGPEASAPKDHTQIGKEVGAIMDSLMEGMSSISDKKSAEEFVAGLEEQKASLSALLKAAKELDPPTAEDKAAVQALKDASDKKGEVMLGNLMKMMAESADAEAIGEVMGKINADQEMKEITEEIEALYDLKDTGEEPPATE